MVTLRLAQVKALKGDDSLRCRPCRRRSDGVVRQTRECAAALLQKPVQVAAVIALRMVLVPVECLHAWIYAVGRRCASRPAQGKQQCIVQALSIEHRVSTRLLAEHVEQVISGLEGTGCLSGSTPARPGCERSERGCALDVATLFRQRGER